MAYDPNITCAYLYTITLHGYPPEAADTPRHLHEVASLGFSSVELEGIGNGHLNSMYKQRESIKDCLDSLSLEVPVFCAVLPGLGSTDEKVRREALRDFRTGCEMAAFLGAGAVLDNGPLIPYSFPEDMPVLRHYEVDVLAKTGLPPGFVWNDYEKVLSETMAEACDIAAGYGLDYLLHPCTGSLTDTTDGFLLLDSLVNRDNLKFNLDTANQFHRGDNLALSVHRLGRKLGYIHISDNNGSRTEHLPAGSGAIDWDPFFEALRQTGFRGRFGIDVGGAESNVPQLDDAYRHTAGWLETMIKRYGLYE